MFIVYVQEFMRTNQVRKLLLMPLAFFFFIRSCQITSRHPEIKLASSSSFFFYIPPPILAFVFSRALFFFFIQGRVVNAYYTKKKRTRPSWWSRPAR